MGDKTIEDAKKQVAAEVKQLAKKIEKPRADADALRAEQAELDKKKAPTDADKKRSVDIRKATQALMDKYQQEADGASARISNVIKTTAPKDQKQVEEWQKHMSKWYVDFINKEPGLDLGDGLSITGELSIKDKKGMIHLKGKF